MGGASQEGGNDYLVKLLSSAKAVNLAFDVESHPLVRGRCCFYLLFIVSGSLATSSETKEMPVWFKWKWCNCGFSLLPFLGARERTMLTLILVTK